MYDSDGTKGDRGVRFLGPSTTAGATEAIGPRLGAARRTYRRVAITKQRSLT